MARVRSQVRSLCLGVGAVGGTVAVLAVALESYWNNVPGLKTHLVAETDEPNNRQKWISNWDRMEPEPDANNNETVQTKAKRNIILIRHGQYNLMGDTDKERYLTQLGLEQARLTGLRLAELALPFTSISVSRMTRAIQTTEQISKALPNVPVLPQDGLLNEGAPIAPEPPKRKWTTNLNCEVDGVRIEAAFRKYFHRAHPSQEKDSYEIVVCHANVIRYFVCRALQIPPEAWLRLSLHHASLTWVVIGKTGQVHIRGLGDAGHFAPELLTTT